MRGSERNETVRGENTWRMLICCLMWMTSRPDWLSASLARRTACEKFWIESSSWTCVAFRDCSCACDSFTAACARARSSSMLRSVSISRSSEISSSGTDTPREIRVNWFLGIGVWKLGEFLEIWGIFGNMGNFWKYEEFLEIWGIFGN